MDTDVYYTQMRAVEIDATTATEIVDELTLKTHWPKETSMEAVAALAKFGMTPEQIIDAATLLAPSRGDTEIVNLLAYWWARGNLTLDINKKENE